MTGRINLQVNHVCTSRSVFCVGTFIVLDEVVVAETNIAVEAEPVRQIFELAFFFGREVFADLFKRFIIRAVRRIAQQSLN